MRAALAAVVDSKLDVDSRAAQATVTVAIRRRSRARSTTCGRSRMAEYLSYVYEDMQNPATGATTARAWRTFSAAAKYYPVPLDHPDLIDPMSECLVYLDSSSPLATPAHPWVAPAL
jgi:hypothetical protein